MPATTPKYGFRYPLASEAPDVVNDIRHAVEDIEAVIATDSQGVLASRPLSSGGTPGKSGRYYMVRGDADPTQNGVVYRDNGAGWDIVGAVAAGAITTSKIAAGAVTLAKLGADVPLFPVGGSFDWPWAQGFLPANTALCYGQAVSRATYAEMFAIANGTGLSVYGAGNGSTTFNLPDLRGRVTAGRDDMGGTATSRITVAVSGFDGTTLGAAGGAQGVTLLSLQMPAHNHGITGSPGIVDPSHSHASLFNTGIASGVSAHRIPFADSTDGYINNMTAEYTGITVNAGSLGTAFAGNGLPHLNVQPTIIVNKVMRIL